MGEIECKEESWMMTESRNNEEQEQHKKRKLKCAFAAKVLHLFFTVSFSLIINYLL